MTKKVFIAYFDFLGFKQFILNNNADHLNTRTDHILRDIERALSKNGPVIDIGLPHMVYDFSNSKINCINFSDTMVFWTQDDSIDSLKELIEVATVFNSSENIHFFPIRGCITHGDLDAKTGNAKSKNDTLYRPNFIYGKGLIDAYELAESLDMAGTVVTNEVLDFLKEKKEEVYINQNFLKFQAYYKQDKRKDAYFLPLVNLKRVITKDSPPFNPDQLLKNLASSIIKNFSADNKSIDPRTQLKIERTTEFLKLNINSIQLVEE